MSAIIKTHRSCAPSCMNTSMGTVLLFVGALSILFIVNHSIWADTSWYHYTRLLLHTWMDKQVYSQPKLCHHRKFLRTRYSLEKLRNKLVIVFNYCSETFKNYHRSIPHLPRQKEAEG